MQHSSTEQSTVDPESPKTSRAFLKRYQPQIRKYARLFVVPNLLAELDRAVANEIPNAIAQTMTSEECVATLIKLGLPPVDLKMLLK